MLALFFFALAGSITAPAPASPSASLPVIEGPFGDAALDFGRRWDPESSPEAPSSFDVGLDGSIHVLDQVHGRILSFSAGGTPTGQTSLDADSFEDLAVLSDGRFVVVDRLVGRILRVVRPSGEVDLEVPIQGPGLWNTGLVTALILTGDGVWLEVEHAHSVRLLDADLNPDTARLQVPGRPMRFAPRFVQAALAGDRWASLTLSAPGSGELLAERAILFSGPVARLLEVALTAESGLVVVAALAADDATRPGWMQPGPIEIVHLSPDGRPLSRRQVPPPDPPWQSLREVRVGPDGTVHQMRLTEDGVELRRWSP